MGELSTVQNRESGLTPVAATKAVLVVDCGAHRVEHDIPLHRRPRRQRGEDHRPVPLEHAGFTDDVALDASADGLLPAPSIWTGGVGWQRSAAVCVQARRRSAPCQHGHCDAFRGMCW